MRRSPCFVWMVAVTLLAGACGGGGSGSEPRSELAPNPAAFVEGEPYRPQIDPTDFADVVDNPYPPARAPHRPGLRGAFRG
jgi:hypothetical protein